jgi:hypothetical protein
MAVICCATPSELYLEDTRSTLKFALDAKLVKTRAQVDEILDNRSLIEKLQRELKEAKATIAAFIEDASSTKSHLSAKLDNLCNESASHEGVISLEGDLESERSTAKEQGRLSKIANFHEIARLNKIIHERNGDSPRLIYNDDGKTIQAGAVKFSLSTTKGRKRCYSDGGINDTKNSDPQKFGAFSSPTRGGDVTKLHA